MKLRANVFLSALGVALGANLAIPAWAARDAHTPSNNLYIIRMAEQPAVAYTGGIAGLKATKPARGKKIDPLDADVVRYAAFLDSRHDAAVLKAGGRKVYSYHYTFNGFAAALTQAQADALAADPSVVSVEKDEARKMDTATTPAFLGLTASNGLWSLGARGKGENVIIGMVDGGFWPEAPSFSDRTGVNGNATQDGKLDYQQIPGWHGKCVPGDFFNASMCNQKVIGAQWFNAGWGGNAGVAAQLPWEFNSPRDYGGHGTHTASTAGGNGGVQPDGAAAGFPTISGMAPRARLAIYKVCFQTPDGGSCFNSDSVAAIDQAVADGVDVINFSISGSQTNFRDSVEIAFMFAADAGVFVAASAGNSGPGNFTVAHPGPWLTTVAAGTHPRYGEAKATLGNGAIYTGASVAAPVASSPFIDSTAAGLPGADPTMVRLCFAAVDNVVAGTPTPVLDPARVAGKIVLCERGTTARVNKSLAVAQAGGSGMILVNSSAAADSINPDLHYVPTVHVAFANRGALHAYAATAGATASIGHSVITNSLAAPFTASFSSRGPLRASADLLKPDIIAPGQEILAAVAPPGNIGRGFDIYNGTSMSSPHIAGIAAIFKSLYPSWSPMMIKSALMTTAYDVLDGPNTSAGVIFNQGAGHVAPNKAADPGLVFDSNIVDWLGFLCGTQLPTSFCIPSGIPVLDPSDFNGASIAIGDLAGIQNVTRRVTNVSRPGTYNVTVAGLAGTAVTVTPNPFTINPGETKTLTFNFTRTTAPLNTYRGGQITMSDGTHSVRIPVVIAPVALAAPAQVSGDYTVKFGFNGAFSATPRGLIPAATADASVKGSGGQDFDKAATNGTVTKFTFTIPAGTTYARFSLFDAFADAGSDLDLYVYRGADPATETLVGVSGGSTAAEEVNLSNPAADTYTVYVHGFNTAGATANFRLFSWLLGSASEGNMTVSAPASGTIGGTGNIGLVFSGLAPATKYLGAVAYGASAAGVAPTIVRVDTP